MTLKVTLIEHTPNPEKVIAAAAKLCYSTVGVDEITENLNKENTEKFLNRLMSYGHTSPIEHVSFTFAIEGVSRTLTHQLVRHRLASYSQQSQRYVKLEQFEFVIPPAISDDEEAREIFISAMQNSQKAYDDLTERLLKKYIIHGMSKIDAEKKAIEDARYVFPNACETKIVVTMNARTLMNFFQHRTCNRAQWEIHNLADEMLLQVKTVAPILFKLAGPVCIKEKCPEGAMTCGKIENVREKYSNL
jgi:thymidylate synthase (FAD)